MCACCDSSFAPPFCAACDAGGCLPSTRSPVPQSTMKRAPRGVVSSSQAVLPPYRQVAGSAVGVEPRTPQKRILAWESGIGRLALEHRAQSDGGWSRDPWPEAHERLPKKGRSGFQASQRRIPRYVRQSARSLILPGSWRRGPWYSAVFLGMTVWSAGSCGGGGSVGGACVGGGCAGGCGADCAAAAGGALYQGCEA